MNAEAVVVLATTMFVFIHIGAMYFTWKKLMHTDGRRERISLLFDLLLFLGFAWGGAIFLFHLYS